jgi:DNA mismatch repair ATPase MutS
MAHIGSFVPCSSAIISVTDKILTRIRTPSSITKNESTFYTDLKQARLAVEEVTSKSLVLLDEFGKGTTTCGMNLFNADGIGLYASIVKDISLKDPKLIISTHYYEMFSVPIFQAIPLQFYTFALHSDSNRSQFLYRLISGACERSLGIECAKRVGLPDVVIERGKTNSCSNSYRRCNP